jgi:transposase
MKPISIEKRALIIAAKERGEKEDDIAIWLGISKRSVGGIWALYKSSGSFLPIPYKGRKSRLSTEQVSGIRNEVRINPDITLHELQEKLCLPIKKSQLSRLLIKLGYSYKKRHFIRKTSSEQMFKKNVQNGIRA